MPIIKPSLITYEPFKENIVSFDLSESEATRIRNYLDIPDKKCPNCGTINFGRNERCPFNYGSFKCGHVW